MMCDEKIQTCRERPQSEENKTVKETGWGKDAVFFPLSRCSVVCVCVSGVMGC